MPLDLSVPISLHFWINPYDIYTRNALETSIVTTCGLSHQFVIIKRWWTLLEFPVLISVFPEYSGRGSVIVVRWLIFFQKQWHECLEFLGSIPLHFLNLYAHEWDMLL